MALGFATGLLDLHPGASAADETPPTLLDYWQRGLSFLMDHATVAKVSIRSGTLSFTASGLDIRCRSASNWDLDVVSNDLVQRGRCRFEDSTSGRSLSREEAAHRFGEVPPPFFQPAWYVYYKSSDAQEEGRAFRSRKSGAIDIIGDRAHLEATLRAMREPCTSSASADADLKKSLDASNLDAEALHRLLSGSGLRDLRP